MKLLIATIIFILASCSNQQNANDRKFNRLIPDTSKSWAGHMTQEAFNQTRLFENKLKLESILDGVKKYEFRVWNLSRFYDPQIVFIAKLDTLNSWTLRAVSFYNAKPDSIGSDNVRILQKENIDNLNLEKYWVLTSQSDMRLGDSYGCNDGGDIFIEMADQLRYRFLWYRCPGINKDKDSSFHLTAELTNNLKVLANEH